MKSSDFLNKLNRELDETVPELSDALKNTPIETRAPADRKPVPGGRRLRFRILSVAAAVLILCIAAAGIVLGLPGKT